MHALCHTILCISTQWMNVLDFQVTRVKEIGKRGGGDTIWGGVQSRIKCLCIIW